MMKIPSEVKILHKNYAIEERECLVDGQDELYGQIHYLKEKILLNSMASYEQRKATILHEILHGLDEAYCIELEEKQVQKLGNALYTFIKDNPCLFAE